MRETLNVWNRKSITIYFKLCDPLSNGRSFMIILFCRAPLVHSLPSWGSFSLSISLSSSWHVPMGESFSFLLLCPCRLYTFGISCFCNQCAHIAPVGLNRCLTRFEATPHSPGPCFACQSLVSAMVLRVCVRLLLHRTGAPIPDPLKFLLCSVCTVRHFSDHV